MSNEFDFRIKQSVYVQALETYKKMETLLDAERNKQQEKAASMNQNWNGISAAAYQNASNFFYRQGKYEETYKQVKGMRSLMEETLPTMNALLARCEGFVDQLNSDSYVEPIVPAEGDNTERNGGILALNYDKIAAIKDLCDEVEEENVRLRLRLNAIMIGCSNLISGTDGDMNALSAASRKLSRIQNFKESFQRYETGVRALEFDMNIRLCALSEDTAGMRELAGISDEEWANGELDIEDVYNPAYLTEISRMCVEVNPVYLNPHGPSMEDFWTTNGLSDYEGRLIETCAIFEKGNLNLFIRTCPDGECADMIKEQQVYGIFITDSVYIDYVPSDYSGLSVQLTETMEYQDVMSTLTEEQRNEWEKTILKFLGCCGTNLLDEGKGKIKDLTGDIIKEGLDEDVIKCLGPVGFVTGQICSLSKDMKEWAEQYQEELTNLIHKCIEIENGNLIKDAVLLDMNVVTSYSGIIENATLESWENINGTEPDILKGTEWTAGMENLLGEDYMQMTYLGVFDGDEYNASTEEKVQELNQQLIEGINQENIYNDLESVNILEEWLDSNKKIITMLSYQDYINMDLDTINAVKSILENYK